MFYRYTISMISRLVRKPYCLVLAQLLLAFYSSQQAASQLDHHQSHSFDEGPHASLFPGEEDSTGDEYSEEMGNHRGMQDLVSDPFGEIDYLENQMKRTWGRNSMNVWGKRSHADKSGKLSRGSVESMVGRIGGRHLDDHQRSFDKHSLHGAQLQMRAESKGLKIAKRGWTPKHEDSRWIEYNYLRRAKMAPQWGRNNMHVWG